LANRVLSRPFLPTPLAAVLEGYGDFSALPIWERILQPLFYACFVAHSIDLKLIDLENLYVGVSTPPLEENLRVFLLPTPSHHRA
jgi:hypothetical protein